MELGGSIVLGRGRGLQKFKQLPVTLPRHITAIRVPTKADAPLDWEGKPDPLKARLDPWQKGGTRAAETRQRVSGAEGFNIAARGARKGRPLLRNGRGPKALRASLACAQVAKRAHQKQNSWAPPGERIELAHVAATAIWHWLPGAATLVAALALGAGLVCFIGFFLGFRTASVALIEQRALERCCPRDRRAG